MALTKIQQMFQNEEARVQRQREIVAAQTQPAPVAENQPATLSAVDFAKTVGTKGVDISPTLPLLDGTNTMTVADFAEAYAQALANLTVGIGQTLNGTI